MYKVYINVNKTIRKTFTLNIFVQTIGYHYINKQQVHRFADIDTFFCLEKSIFLISISDIAIVCEFYLKCCTMTSACFSLVGPHQVVENTTSWSWKTFILSMRNVKLVVCTLYSHNFDNCTKYKLDISHRQYNRLPRSAQKCLQQPDEL